MNCELEKVEINGVSYIREDQANMNEKVTDLEGKEYCIVRTYSAGVFAGFIDRNSVVNRCGTVFDARRLWRWSGAASLSQLSVDGTSNPSDCKFYLIENVDS